MEQLKQQVQDKAYLEEEVRRLRSEVNQLRNLYWVDNFFHLTGNGECVFKLVENKLLTMVQSLCLLMYSFSVRYQSNYQLQWYVAIKMDAQKSVDANRFLKGLDRSD